MRDAYELISVTNRNGMISTTSLNIAEVYGKKHYNVLRDIANLAESFARVRDKAVNSNLSSPHITIKEWTEGKEYPAFIASSYVDDQGKPQPMFILNRNATYALLLGYTGDNAMYFRTLYMFMFDAMFLELHMPSDLPNTHISNVNYDACDKLISEYKKALDKPSDTGSIAAAKLKGKILKMAVGFDPVEEYDKQWNFEAKAYNDKCIADMKAREKAEKEWEAEKKRKEAEEHNPYKNPDIDDSLYDDVPF